MSITKKDTTYLVYNRDYGLYKIGFTTNLFERLKTLRCYHENSIVVVCINYNIERQLHAMYFEKRVRFNGESEWFILSSKDVEEIRGISFMHKDVLGEISLLKIKTDNKDRRCLKANISALTKNLHWNSRFCSDDDLIKLKSELEVMISKYSIKHQDLKMREDVREIISN